MPTPIAAGIAMRLMQTAEGAIGSAVARAVTGAVEELGDLEDPNLLQNRTEVMVPVSSSAIRMIGYNVAGIIIVEFNRGGDSVYYYPGSAEDFIDFVTAPSKGQWFNQHLNEREAPKGARTRWPRPPRIRP